METTTHAAWGAGRPRLAVAHSPEQREFMLDDDEMLIGSAPDSAIVLPGIDPIHARIVHTADDEYVLTLVGEGTMNALSDDEDEPTEVLRHGAIFTMGEWTLVFMRDEYADHGRPYGGRQGGEGARQKAQPERPDYSEQHEEECRRREEGRRLATGAVPVVPDAATRETRSPAAQ